MKSPPPESGNSAPLERRSSGPPPVPKTESTDFSSLMEGGVETRGTKAPPPVTDFRSLKSQAFTARKRLIKRTATDWIIEVFTPVMIFVMVYAIIFFLLDVRHVYLGLHESADRIALAYDGTLRMVAFFFVVGVVALNRLIARDGKNESIIYIFGLALAIGIFTFTTTEQMGSVAHNFMNSPGLATLFNMFLVAFVWWGTNRLTHECCVDDDPTAGEIGILTGTARRLQNVVRKASQPPAAKKARKQEPMILSNEFQPFDPSAPKKKKKPAAPPALAKATARLSKRHPGISIFYTSIPVMFAFAIGQRVLANGEPDRLLKAHYFIAAYTVSALALLMLSSLGGLRQYFRTRRIAIPGGVGSFWIGLGSVMILMVIFGATWLPSPSLPRAARLASAPSQWKTPESEGDADASDSDGAGSGSDAHAVEDAETGRSAPDPNSRDGQAPGDQGDKTTSAEGGQQEGGDDGGSSQSEGKAQERSRGKGNSSGQSKPPPKPKMPSINLPDAPPLVNMLGKAILVVMAIFGVFALIRVLGLIARGLGRGRNKSAGALRRFFAALDRFLQRITKMPTLPKFQRKVRISRDVSLSIQYRNPLADPVMSKRMSPAEIVEYSYTALCALAHDLAVPREDDQTPFEFIQSFPKPLDTLREDARDLTNLYVVSAYSNLALEQNVYDRVRKFWHTYERVRAAVVR